MAVLFAHLHEPPPPIAAYPQLDPVLATALAKDRDDRYQSCGELVDAAREALGLRDVVLVRDRKSLLLVVVGALVLAGALAAGLVLTLGGGGPAKPSTKPTLTPRGDSLQRIDPKTNKLLATIGVGHNPRTVAAGDGRVWVGSADDQSVLWIDPRTNEITHRWTTAGPDSIATGFGAVFVANADRTLTRIDPSTLSIANHLNTGYRWVAVGEGAIWTVGSRGLVRANREGFVVKTIGVGFHPFEVVTGGGAVWVLDDKLLASGRSIRGPIVSSAGSRSASTPGACPSASAGSGSPTTAGTRWPRSIPPPIGSCDEFRSATDRSVLPWARARSGRRTTSQAPSRESIRNEAR